MNRHLLDKNEDVFPQNSTFFIHNLKNRRCHSKIIFGHASFQLLFESTFSLKLSLLLDSSIR